eukprot:CAMPEP_0204610750 /NCGR_PEP_ID=MMETSP0661-20131031/61668_1 /ASSEMBLY_ACC=CAM_ASM_000606 /TAXON_ID=109239 /ORGANISM="Alexandrium margalefi, Strain AMGDE01CS-322" /LENGTH=387 /DNA_ID=CAMNT_0051622575 /DNA_START=62 /DNA_END=1226 /DNA_ORIENTATION=+
MPSHNKLHSLPGMVALGAGCAVTAPLFVMPGLRGAPGQLGVQPSSAKPAGAAGARAASAPIAGLALMGAASLAAGARVSARRPTARGAAAAAAEEAAEAPPPPPPFDPAKQLGAMVPVGFFDPLGFSKVGDEEGFRNLRSAELKHGRVAMMAAAGAVVQHYVKFPGFDAVPGGLGAVASPPGTYGFVALFVLAGVLELFVWTQDPAKEVGDFGDPVGLGMYDDDMRSKELNNGRFAMFAAFGIIAAELLTGKDGVQQLGAERARRPRCAVLPSKEPIETVGSMPRIPDFRGSVAIFSSAADQQAGLIERRLVAIADKKKAGVLELFVWTQDPAKEVGDFGDPVGLGMYDDDMRSKELNNGRFAMFAAFGIIAAELLTGKDGVQQLGA